MLARKPANPKASARPLPPPVVPAKRGRPAFEPTPMQRETVKVMTAGGIQQPAIAGVLGISEPTLRRHFRKEIANGAAEVGLMVVAAHLKRIRAGDMRAIEWWERSRMGWTERGAINEGKLADVPLRVIIELVGDAAPVQIEQERPRRPDFDATKRVEFVG